MIKRILLAILLATSPVLTSLPLQAQEEQVEAPVAQSVNINGADAEALARVLVGVGMSRAKAIVRYREEFGPFLSVEDLLEVRGIGRSTLKKNLERITLE